MNDKYEETETILNSDGTKTVVTHRGRGSSANNQINYFFEQDNSFIDPKFAEIIEKTKNMTDDELVSSYMNLRDRMTTVEDLERCKELAFALDTRGIAIPKKANDNHIIQTRTDKFNECTSHLPGEEWGIDRAEYNSNNEWAKSLKSLEDEELFNACDELMDEITRMRDNGIKVNMGPKHRLEKIWDEIFVRGLGPDYWNKTYNDSETLTELSSTNAEQLNDFTNIDFDNYDTKFTKEETNDIRTHKL